MSTLPTANANDIVVELESVADFIRERYPETDGYTYYYQAIPEMPDKHNVAVRFQNAPNPVQETALTYVEQREWQIVYFGGKTDAEVTEALTFMQGIAKQTANKRRVLPIKDDSLRYMRIGSFSFGQPVKTEDNRHAIIGVLTTEVRKARDVEAYDKIMELNTRLRII